MPIVVEPYNPLWPQQFAAIKSELEILLRGVNIISIEHVGSTSVPNLAAKPLLDIDVVVTRENLQPAIDALVTGDLLYMGELNIEDRHAFRSPWQDPPRNLYVCIEGSAALRNHLAVRDLLRSNAELREEYGSFKMDLGARGLEIHGYMKAKSAMVVKLLQLSGGVSEEELEAIKNATAKGERLGPVKTERLVLREFVIGDWKGLFDLESKPEVVRYQTWPPRTMKEAQELCVEIVQNHGQVPRPHIELAVIHEGSFIGRIGALVKRRNEKGEELEKPHLDLWFSFLPECQGKGFATEAMKAFIPLLVKPSTLEIECDPRNIGSWKLAERLGFRKVSLTKKVYECKGEWVDSLVYQMDSDE